MRILIVSQYFPPDITAAAFRIYDTAKLLTQNEHEVCVITAYPHKAQAVDGNADGLDFSPVIVRRSKIIKIGSGGLKNYLKHYLSFMFNSIWVGLRQRLRGWKPDIIWASSPPLFVGLSGHILSVLLRCPLVLDIRDIWPDSAVSASQISANSFAYRFGKKMERYLYNRASRITCVAEPMRQYIAAKTNTRVSVVYNGVLEQISNESPRPSHFSTESNTHKTILYAGNLGRVQQLDLLIMAYAELLEHGHLKDWCIRLLGAGAMADHLKSLVLQLHLQEKVFIDPPVTREVTMQKLEVSDLLFISLLPDEVLTMTIPSKLFDYMLAAKPILGGISGEGKSILESTGSNVCYRPGRMNSLKQALRKATTEHRKLRELAHRNKALVLSKYTRQASVSKLVSIFNN